MTTANVVKELGKRTEKREKKKGGNIATKCRETKSSERSRSLYLTQGFYYDKSLWGKQVSLLKITEGEKQIE